MVMLLHVFRQQKIIQRLSLTAKKTNTDQLLRQFYELPFIGMAIISPEAKHFFQFNNRFCEMLGYTREELTSKTWWELTHSEDLDTSIKSFDELLSGEIKHCVTQKRFICEDGHSIFTREDVRCVRKSEGGVDYIIATIDDINEQKLIETRSDRLKKLYTDLADMNEQIIHATDEHQLLDYLCRIPIKSGLMSMAWIGVEDYDTQQLIPVIKHGQGVDYLDNVTISTRAERAEGRGVTCIAYREKKIFINNDSANNSAMAPWRTQGLKYAWGSCASFPIFRQGDIYALFTMYNADVDFFDNEVTALITTLTNDVSYALDKIDANQNLIRSEARNRLLLESAHSGIWGLDSQGNTTFVNPAAAKMLGYLPEELTGVSMHDKVHHSDVDGSSCLKEECAIILTLKDGVGRNVNNEIFWCKDGSFISVEYTTHPIYQKGVLQGSVMVFQDITERKQAELLAQKQRNELNQLARATMLGELSTTLAHELNQPLAAILSNAQAAQRFLLKENCDLNEVREILKDIVADNNRASEVISRLRQMLKENSVEQKVLNVNEMVIDVLKLVQNDLTNRNILIKITLTPQIPSIMGDRVLLQQVLLNLILNACDASIFATSEEKSQLNIYTQANSDTVQVTVTDQGHGIGLDVMERIFEPLFTTKPQGIGLGLSICRNIIKVHKGQLWAENNSDRGASFHFSIPSYSEKSI